MPPRAEVTQIDLERASELHEAATETFEQPYLTYWQDLLDRYRDSLHADPTTRHTLEATQRRVLRLDQILSDQKPGRFYDNEASLWYHSLGSLNDMEGAQEALVRAAGAMERAADSVHGKSYNNLLAGNMYHEAALLSDPVLRPWLLQAALDRYQKVIDANKGPVATREIAQRYKYDLLFQALYDTVQFESNGIWDDEKKRYFKELLAEQSEIFDQMLERDYERYSKEAGRLSKMTGEDRKMQRQLVHGLRGTVAGKAYEWFALLGLRYWQVRQDRFGQRTVRSSFAREQEIRFSFHNSQLKRSGEPHQRDLKMKPKHSIDTVVHRYGFDGRVTLERWQLKTRQVGKKEYLGEIVPLEAGVSPDRSNLPFKEKRFEYADFDRFVALMGEATRIFARHCQGEELSQEEAQVAAAALKYVRPPRYVAA